jgi:hypothetical protein
MNTFRRIALVALVILAATMVVAQEKPKRGEPGLRTIRGTVVDKDEAPLEAAVVYLKNVHTNDIVTRLSESDGQFRFTGLDLNVDYEIHAEHEGWTSSSHTVSNFDTRKEFVLTLRLDHKKTGK